MNNPTLHVDPVCLMQVDPASAAATSNVGETTFYFCGPMCKRTFDEAPARYAGVDATTSKQ